MARIYYCNGLLYGVPTVHLSKLQRLQNSAARLITHTPRYFHITLVLLALHWLPVKFRICHKIAVISFKAIHNLGPAYLSNLINIKRCSCSNLQSNVGVILLLLLLLLLLLFNGSRHDCYPQFPRSPLGTSGTMADHLRKTDGKKTAEVLDSPYAKASLTN